MQAILGETPAWDANPRVRCSELLSLIQRFQVVVRQPSFFGISKLKKITKELTAVRRRSSRITD